MRGFKDVDADINQRSAALQILAPEYTPVGNPAPAQRLHPPVQYFAQFPVVDRLLDKLRARLVAMLEANDQLFAVLPRRIEHFLALARVHFSKADRCDV